MMAAALFAAAAWATAATDPTGALCMARLPGPLAFASEGKGAATDSYDDSEAARRRRRQARHAFTVEVDGAKRVTIDQRRGACVDGLAYRGSHVAVLRRLDGSAVGSARFSFERRGVTELELRYEIFYTTVLIENPLHPRRPGSPRLATVATPERALGAIDHWGGRITVPEEGLRFTFRGPTRTGNRRTMVNVTASAAPVEGHTAVRLTVSHPPDATSSSSPACFERDVQAPPFQECTALAGGGWDDGAPRDVALAIDNLAGTPVEVDLRIVIMDPLEK
jgi:hypothetical protein